MRMETDTMETNAMETDAMEDKEHHGDDKMQKMKDPYRFRINWYMTSLVVFLHIGAGIGLYFGLTSANPKTLLFALIYGLSGGLGTTAGNHRMWCHRSYKGRFPLRLLYCILTTIAHQKSIFVWCREHRMHHRYTETDADPYNIKRGFFFAHIGWIMCHHHPEYKAKIDTVSMKDLLDDPIVRFEKKYHIVLKTFISFIIPNLIPVVFWHENIVKAFFVAVTLRICSGLHITSNINSVAHTFGYRPYCKDITARDNPLMSALAMGEGWHNYHHIFPWDYSTSELGYTFNMSKVFIDIMAKLGLAYDLKTATAGEIERIKLKAEID